MKKLILLSVILAILSLPARAARIKDPRVGLKKALIQMAIFDVIYLFLLLFVWPRFQ